MISWEGTQAAFTFWVIFHLSQFIIESKGYILLSLNHQYVVVLM